MKYHFEKKTFTKTFNCAHKSSFLKNLLNIINNPIHIMISMTKIEILNKIIDIKLTIK